MNVTFSRAKSTCKTTQIILHNNTTIGEVEIRPHEAGVYSAHVSLHLPELVYSAHRLIQGHSNTKESALIKAIHSALHECEDVHRKLLAIAKEMDIPALEKHPEELKP